MIVLSFDDGRKDAFLAYKVLKKHNLVGTFHICTGFVDGTYVTDNFGKNRKPLTIEDLHIMKQDGMEICSHGDRHTMDTGDFVNSLSKLYKWGVASKKVGFSVPNSDYTPESIQEFVNDNIDRLNYIRVGRSSKCYSFIMKLCFAAYRVFHLQLLFNIFNKYNVISDFNKYNIVSIVIRKDTRWKHIKRFVDKYDRSNNLVVLMFHSIVDKPQGKWEYSIKHFERLCAFLSNEKVDTLEHSVSILERSC